jgi:hypothetical protein
MKRLYIAVIVMTASCSSHQTIPENWKPPASAEGEKCPDMPGHYMNSGESTDKKSHVYLQSHWFFGEYEKYSVPPGKWMDNNNGINQFRHNQFNGERQLHPVFCQDWRLSDRKGGVQLLR